MTTLPERAECRSVLADGTELTVTALRRARANRADVKCAILGAPTLAERVIDVVRLARHTEARIDSRDQVVISMDRVIAPHARDWELAAVLADRMVRGLCHWPHAVTANGWSDAWHLGRVGGCDRAGPASTPLLLLGGASDASGASDATGVWHLSHLGALDGHPDPGASVSSACAWFPLHSGGADDVLCKVEVSVYPLHGGGGEEEESIAVPALDMTQQLAVRQALVGARQFDPRGLGRWRTLVRFGQNLFHGNSFELALVLADRIARGREMLPRARLIASGCSSAWHSGRVDPVEACEAKSALIARYAGAGDRVLLPAAWQAQLTDTVLAQMRANGALCAFVERIGMI